LHGGERVLERFAAVTVVAVFGKPVFLVAPVDVLLGCQMSSRPKPKPNIFRPIDS